MALVAYDYSDTDSDGEESDNDKNKQDIQIPSSVGELFSSLPKPKQSVVNIVEENVDDILLKNKVNTDKQNKKAAMKEPVKIAIPALVNYNSDDEDTPKKIVTKIVTTKATGLFSILPSPKCTPPEKPKFDASVVKQKNLIPRTIKKTSTKRQHDSDDEELVEGHFFSSIFSTNNKLPPVAPLTSLKMQVDSAKPVKDMSGKSNDFFSNLVASSAKKAEEEAAEKNAEFEENAIEELCGKRHKKMKDGIEMIDINAADIMPDSRDWRTKALTEEAPSASVKKGEEPSLQSRRKHQITYLAYQAKVNEQELKNQWALNRMTRKQTQAKYGF